MLVRLTAALALLIVLPAVSGAQTPRERQAEAMARLHSMIGTWRVGGVRHTRDGAEPLRQGAATVALELDGRVLVERGQIDLAADDLTRIRTLFSYDPYRDVYRVMSIDEAYGLMDIYEGGFDAQGRLAVTNLRSDTHFPIESGRLHFQLRWDLSDPDAHGFDVLMTTDGGASWRLYYEQTYTRTGADGGETD